MTRRSLDLVASSAPIGIASDARIARADANRISDVVVFLVIHLALTILEPKTLVVMIIGRASSPAPRGAGNDRRASEGAR